jgi:hypothetical protein
MDIVGIKNKLILYKTYDKLADDMVKEIEDVLLTRSKLEDFEKLLSKVEFILKK